MDFYAPQFDNGAFLKSFIGAQQAPYAGELARQQVAQGQQGLQEGALKLDQIRMAMRGQQALQDNAISMLRQSGASGTPGAENVGGSSGGIQNGPQGSVYGSSMNVGSQVNPMHALAVGMLVGSKDPYADMRQAQESNIKIAQLQAQGPIALYKSVAESPAPARLVMNNPSLMQQWQQYAQQAGLDPVKDFNDDNVRQAAALAGNQVAGAVGLPTSPMPNPLQKVTDKNGFSYLQNPITHAPTAIPGQETSAEQQRLGMEQRRLALAEKVSNGFNGQAGELLAALTEKGVSLPAGMRSKEQQLATVEGLLTRNPGLSPDEIAEKVKDGKLTFTGENKATQIAGGIVGKVKYAEQELLQSIPLAQEASKNVPRGKFVPLNKLMQMANSEISDPDLLDFKIKTQSVMNAYDMLAARGGTDVGKREEQHKLLMTASSPEAYDRALKAFEQEAKVAGSAGRAAMKPGGDIGQTQTIGGFTVKRVK